MAKTRPHEPNPVKDVGRWVYSTPTHGWHNPYDYEQWRINDVCDITSWRWTTQAACAVTDPEIWFQSEHNTDRRLLGAICSGCPVRAECLEHALFHNEHGYWAGTSRADRRKLARGMDLDGRLGG